ncbi:hypothetical protein [uncultured Sutterella sp.]|uniref:terminase small subunit-like protein n=1 Tax=uncultured Sutterella sp. TaxID=286133 RepID=UPI00206D0E6F|nr:hypothetical protein [uncultured Sutterella sp.]DAL55805.1 MAG TPA_asm: Sf6 terminase small subunit gp1, octamer, DNA-binding, CAPS buffer.65A [Caudoviricetes sp.]
MTSAQKISTGVFRQKLPVQYSDEIAEKVLQRLMDGETLTAICLDLGLKPHQIYTWTEHRDEFARRFARARDFGDLVLEDQAIDLSDSRNADEESGESMTKKGTSTSRRKFDNVARSKLQAETRLKIVARRKGGKITAEIRRTNKREEEQVAEMSDEMLLKIAGLNIEPEETSKE